MNNDVPVKKNSFGKNFLKGYLVCIGVGVVLFFVCAIIKLVVALNSDPSVETGQSSILMVIQFALPMFSFLFGWIPGLIFAVIKDSKK
jgi:hypothetical protein